jgi:S1-C subfamily serine protease
MKRNGVIGGLVVIVVVLAALIAMLATGVIEIAGDDTQDTSRQTVTATVDGFDPARIYRESVGGVALVVAGFASGQQGLGSGFLADEDGHVLTNAHVVAEQGSAATTVQVAFQQEEGASQSRLDAAIVGIDESTDVAVLKVDLAGVEATVLPLGESAGVVIGEPVVAIGNPLGFSFSLTNGIVSGTGRNLQAPNGAVIPNGIQTNAAINQGNSGGPLLDAGGMVIGINEQIASPSGSFSGLGFAVPIDTAKVVMRDIIEQGVVDHAYLGVQGQTIVPAVAGLLGLPAQEGVLVARVAPGSPADDAGLRGGDRTVELQGAVYVVGGDIITELNGEALTGMEQLAVAVAESEPGDEIELTVVRDGSSRSVTVKLGTRPTSGS